MKKQMINFIILAVTAGGLTGCGNIAPSETDNIRYTETENGQESCCHTEEYGSVQESRQEFFDEETGNLSYFYEMEKFFFNDSIPNADIMNQTLLHIYDIYENSYIKEAAAHKYSDGEAVNTPYTYWHLLSIKYIGTDYISILYNDISDMGGAHPYSRFDGITIDCTTGEEISASQLLRKTDEEILAEISRAMGLDDTGSWNDLDFYLTDSAIIFFYRMPGFWEDVILLR